MGEWWNVPAADARCPTSGEWFRAIRQLRPRADVRVDVDQADGVVWFVLPRNCDRLNSSGIGAMVDRLVELRLTAEGRGLAVRYRRG